MRFLKHGILSGLILVGTPTKWGNYACALVDSSPFGFARLLQILNLATDGIIQALESSTIFFLDVFKRQIESLTMEFDDSEDDAKLALN